MSGHVKDVRCSNVRGLEAKDVMELSRIIELMIACMAKADAQGVEVPEEFLTHFGVVRSVLMRKCIGPNYTELQFCEFFGVMLKAAGEVHKVRPARMAVLEASNQLVQ